MSMQSPTIDTQPIVPAPEGGAAPGACYAVTLWVEHLDVRYLLFLIGQERKRLGDPLQGFGYWHYPDYPARLLDRIGQQLKRQYLGQPCDPYHCPTCGVTYALETDGRTMCNTSWCPALGHHGARLVEEGAAGTTAEGTGA